MSLEATLSRQYGFKDIVGGTPSVLGGGGSGEPPVLAPNTV